MSVLIFGSGFGPGELILEDDGAAGNGISQLRWNTSSVIPFANPADSLTVSSMAGQSFAINMTDSLTTGTFTIGSLTDASITPDALAIRNIESAAAMTMVATGKIVERGKDNVSDITAASLILSAGTGIGQANAIEMRVSSLEAETSKGGINIYNFGSVTVGGLTADVGGLSVGTSGSVNLTALGSIALSDATGAASVKSGDVKGDVILNAVGAGSSIYSIVDRDSISAAGGSIVLQAGANVMFGTSGADFDNDVRAKGGISITTGGYFYIDGFSDIAADDFGANTGKGIDINAANGIYILDNQGTDAGLAAGGTAGADVILKAGPGTLFSLQAVSTAAIFSSSGDVSVSADVMTIATDSGITASNGRVTLKPTTDGWRVELGSAGDPSGVLALSDAELDRVFADSLHVGGAKAGNVTFTSSVTLLSTPDLFVQSSANIAVNGGVLVQAAGKLQLRAGDDILVAAGSSLLAGNGIVGYVDFGNTDAGKGGKAQVDAAFGASVRFIGNVDGDTLSGGALGDILEGRGGNDRLTGHGGNDTLKGGGGKDSFVFNAALDAINNVDKITDFSVPQDRIELDDSVFAALGGPGTLSASAFHKGTAAADASDRIIYNPGNGWLLYDADGKNGSAAIHFATLDDGLALTKNDFLVI